MSQGTIRTPGGWLRRQIAGCLLLLLVAPLAAAVPSPQQEAPASQPAEGTSPTEARPGTSAGSAIERQAGRSEGEALPNSPGAIRSQGQLSSGQQPSPKLQDAPPEPLGTAAAPSLKTTGVAASRPAG